MMTVGEHDRLWMSGAQSIINSGDYIKKISNSLRRGNAISVYKELYSEGFMSKEEYCDGLIEILNNEGFILEGK